MAGSSTQGIQPVVHSVSDLATAKEVYAALLGGPPQAEPSPVTYWHVPDIEAKLAEDPDGNVLGLLQDR